MIDFYSLLAFIMAISAFLILPGPVNLIVVNSSIRYGLSGAFWSIVGTNAASILLIAISMLFVSGIASVNTVYLDWLTIAGGIYLLYYGYQLWQDSKRMKMSQHSNSEQQHQNNLNAPFSISKLVTNGFIVGISNPKDIIFFMSFFPPFVTQLGLEFIPSILMLTLIWCVLDYSLLILYSLGMKKIITKKFEILFTLSCMVIFIMIGVYSIYRGISSVY